MFNIENARIGSKKKESTYPHLSARFIERIKGFIPQACPPLQAEKCAYLADDFLAYCDRLFIHVSTAKMGVYFPGEVGTGTAPEEFLENAKDHFKQMEALLGEHFDAFYRRELFFKSEIEGTKTSLIVRRGFLENNWGLEFVLGGEGSNWERSYGSIDRDLALIGINFGKNSAKIVNIQGAKGAKRQINKVLPGELGIRPFNALTLLTAMWATDIGLPRIKGLKDNYQHWLSKNKPSDRAEFNNTILSSVGFTDSGDVWKEVDAKNFYEEILGKLTPSQNEGLSKIALAFQNMKAFDRENCTLPDVQSPFSLSHNPQTIEKLIATTRYRIHKQTP